MKVRITFEPRPGQVAAAIELEAKSWVIDQRTGWLLVYGEDSAQPIVGYPPAVIRSVADVGAFEAAVVKRSENPGRRQQAR